MSLCRGYRIRREIFPGARVEPSGGPRNSRLIGYVQASLRESRAQLFNAYPRLFVFWGETMDVPSDHTNANRRRRHEESTMPRGPVTDSAVVANNSRTCGESVKHQAERRLSCC